MLTEVYRYHLNDWPNCVLTKNCEHLLSKTFDETHLVNGHGSHLTSLTEKQVSFNKQFCETWILLLKWPCCYHIPSWFRRSDANRWPFDSESSALTIRPGWKHIMSFFSLGLLKYFTQVDEKKFGANKRHLCPSLSKKLCKNSRSIRPVLIYRGKHCLHFAKKFTPAK